MLFRSISIFLAVVCLSSLGYAVTDYDNAKAIRDIQRGERNKNAIKDLYVVENAYIKGTTTLAQVNFSGATILSNSATLKSTLGVTGVATFNSNAHVSVNLDVGGTVSITGTTAAVGGLTIGGKVVPDYFEINTTTANYTPTGTPTKIGQMCLGAVATNCTLWVATNLAAGAWKAVNTY